MIAWNGSASEDRTFSLKSTDGATPYGTIAVARASQPSAELTATLNETVFNQFKMTASAAIAFQYISVSYTSATYSGYCTTVKTAPEFTYATASYTVGYGASFETPVLTKPNDLDATQISYSISQNEGVATINATTGAVTIGNNAGTVTVTATLQATTDTFLQQLLIPSRSSLRSPSR